MIQRVLSVVLVSGLVVATTLGASIADNEIESRQLQIHSGEELIDSIMSDCFSGDTFKCLKGRVLCYLDTNLGVAEKSARAFEEDNVDRAIFDRVGRVLSTSEFRMALPEAIFGQTVLTYRPDEGFNFLVPTQRARNGDLKEKLLIPILLLMKLKQKIVLPIVLGLIHLKAVKAFIMSKLAITLVLGFLLHNLLKKKGLLPMPMAMMPMPPPEPAPVYGAPAPSPAPASSYQPSSWEPSSGGPYSRIWEPSTDAQQMAYSSYYPGSSSSSSVSSSSSSGSVGSSISPHAY
ncbi:uncharacterized protein LOC129786270 isoform X1 [Lutzomyia longipalpis]|uniref:uncharacterized protein LOC129786270 isoform X1 n=1 Tax=Lutzomyia longipalpis TaxID=7200 RepID=UPI00248399CB|nr:uncharacterized protein LOC129786270 isoform X1 [Lutzomyia longipalpis]